MNKIILPGDPGWAQPAGIPEVKPEVPKLADEALEQVFSEVVDEVKSKLDAEVPSDPAGAGPVALPSPAAPGPSYKFHRPARKKSISIPMPKPVSATLLENLPRSWERKCYVGGVDYVAVEGQPFKNRVRKPGFRIGDTITLTSLEFYPGVGSMYGFAEGSRGGYAVKPDQVQFELPVQTPEVSTDGERTEDTSSERLPEASE